jgi:hypothetical protein
MQGEKGLAISAGKNGTFGQGRGTANTAFAVEGFRFETKQGTANTAFAVGGGVNLQPQILEYICRCGGATVPALK